MDIRKPLTHDEKKASEAAFRGDECNAKWSKSARAIYDGIRRAMGDSPSQEVSSVNTDAEERTERCDETASTISPSSDIPVEARFNPSHSNQIITRSDALKAGLLVDVTPLARNIGLNIPVGITKSLWEGSINPDSRFSEGERCQRIRDLLMAVRLRLALNEVSSPWIEVPVLLSFPPDPIPQLFSIYALFHKDAVALDCLTLLHPQELSSIHPSQSAV